MLESIHAIASTTPPVVADSGADGSLETLLLLVGSSGVTGLIVALVGLLANKKKVTAEATHQISQAAGSLVDRLEKENERISDECTTLRGRVADLELAESKYLNEIEIMKEKLESQDR